MCIFCAIQSGQYGLVALYAAMYASPVILARGLKLKRKLKGKKLAAKKAKH